MIGLAIVLVVSVAVFYVFVGAAMVVVGVIKAVFYD